MNEVKIITDSICDGARITTLQLTYPRFILSELNIHSEFSCSSYSSRFLPTLKIIEQIERNPAIPMSLNKNKASTKDETDVKYNTSKSLWLKGAKHACLVAREMIKSGLHKDIINKVLEAYTTTSTVITSTEWDNFFALRLYSDEYPEIQELAKAMKIVIDSSTPKETNFHLPYITDNDIPLQKNPKDILDWTINQMLMEISVARIARVTCSQFKNLETTSIDDDLMIFKELHIMDKLTLNSLLEHQATFVGGDQFYKNFKNWEKLREYF